MAKHDVINWLISEATSVLSDLDSQATVSVQTPAEHVDVTEAFDEATYPFIGIRHLAGTPRSGGLGAGNARVTTTNYSNNTIDSAEYATIIDGQFELAPVTENDPAKQHRIADAVASHFDLIVRNGTFGPTIEDITVSDESQADRTSEYIRSTGVELSVTYTRSNTEPVTAAESVNVNVDDGQTNNTTDPNEFDYTYSG